MQLVRCFGPNSTSTKFLPCTVNSLNSVCYWLGTPLQDTHRVHMYPISQDLVETTAMAKTRALWMATLSWVMLSWPGSVVSLVVEPNDRCLMPSSVPVPPGYRQSCPTHRRTRLTFPDAGFTCSATQYRHQ